MPRNSKNSDDEMEFRPKGGMGADYSSEIKNKKNQKNDLYTCGDLGCGKCYHSYTAFYNHCKKSHGGDFPDNSLHNGKIFEGPSKNRGRPRIKKNQTKDELQIQAMKRQNELIEFLGTLKTKKAEELIVHVENPIQRVDNSVTTVEYWLNKNDDLTQQKLSELRNLKWFNRIVAENDLPEFYDPIENTLYKDRLDSYSFHSIYNFMNNSQNRAKFDVKYEGRDLFNKILLVWLGRILSERLLSQVLSAQFQTQPQRQLKQYQLLSDRTQRLRQLQNRFYECFQAEQQQTKKEEV